MKFTLKLTDAELNTLKIGEPDKDGKTPVTFTAEHTGVPTIPPKASTVYMDGNMTVAYIPEVRYAKIYSLQDAIDAVEQIQEYADNYDLDEAGDHLEVAKEKIREAIKE